MKWKKYLIKKVLISASIWVGCLAVAPHLAVAAEQTKATKMAVIESVVSVGDGSATELVIKLSSPATFTSYKTISPLRLVVDFSQVTQGEISAPIVVNKGNFKTVTASRFDTDAGVLTRVEIGLSIDAEAVITTHPSNPGELKIAFPPLTASDTPAVPETNKAGVEPSVATMDSPAIAGASTSFSTLKSVSVEDNKIILALDGAAADFKTFRLNNPERFVVDLMNVKSGLPSKLLPLNASGVASARIGLYPDKTRVVFDAIKGNFPEASAARIDSGIVVTLETKTIADNSKSSTDKPIEKSSETKAASITNKTGKSFGTSSIEMIDFQVVDGVSRVSIKVDGKIDIEKPVSTTGFVTMTIKNSTLPKKLQRSMEARNFVSPVLRITPLQIKTKKGINTKIRIATRITAPYDYRQEGDMIYIDFKHPADMSSEKVFSKTADQKDAPISTKPVMEKEISSDLLPVLDPAVKSVDSSRNYKGRKVTLEFADAEVRKIFQLLSEVSNKNFVLGDEVTGSISLKLVNVPWDQALDIILDTKNLDKREDGNIIIIKGKGKFKSQAEEELEIKKLAAKSIELKTETFSINYADLATIASQFASIKTPERGQITSDARTGKIIVKDTPQALSDMRSLLVQLDVPERQVMIEAKIVEATSTFTRNLGVNWGAHTTTRLNNALHFNNVDTVFGGIASTTPTSGAGTTPGLGISFGTLGHYINVSARLSAAASAGLIKIISSPKVATLNHKPAKISQGQQIPYQNTTATTGAVTAFVAATLSLEVTPHINANGTIVMKIDAKNDAPGTGSPPPINTKQATTEMLLRDGETTVIGGIYVDSEQDGDEGVPYLMDIPVFGHLFKSTAKSKTKTELLIFITPRILGAI